MTELTQEPVQEQTRYAVLDIETGGFSKQKNAICEIGLLIVDDSGTIHDHIEWLIKPYPRPADLQETPGQLVSYKEDAMAINGLTVERLEAEGHDVKYVCEQLQETCQNHKVNILIGHNAKAFDLPWIEYIMDRFDCGSPFRHVWDTMIMAKDQHKGLKSYKLVDLCNHFGLEKQADHTAGGDCHATWALYQRLSQPKQSNEGVGA